jgi:hypothetical protein
VVDQSGWGVLMDWYASVVGIVTRLYIFPSPKLAAIFRFDQVFDTQPRVERPSNLEEI